MGLALSLLQNFIFLTSSIAFVIVFSDALSAALSAFYCKILVLVGVCLPITEVISNQIPNYVYQGFYVYLYMGSILFVAFLYATTLRNRTLFNALKSFRK